MAYPGGVDKASWSEVGNAVADIIDDCKGGPSEFEKDETTGGTMVIGRERKIIIDVRNWKIGEEGRVMGGVVGVETA